MFHKLTEHMAWADVVTLIGTAIGICALYHAILGAFLYSAILFIIAVAVDGLDGYVARRMHRTGEFGVQLDSLSDMIVFGGAIAAFGYAVGLTSIVGVIILTAFVLCGALRLARFNVTKYQTQGYFEGTPIPLNAIIPVIYLVLAYFALDVNYLLIAYAVLAVTMISGFKVPKL